ncbi:MAG: FHA domain-containing protein [Eubacterium sp.]|nr:FHA domain-containing protein [Eubacterium sp.]
MSKIIKCEKGHFFDVDKFGKCPYCNPVANKNKNLKIQGNIEDDLDDAVTVAQNMFAGSARKIKKPHVTGQTIMPKTDIFKEEPVFTAPQPPEWSEKPTGDDGKTVSLFQFESGIDPVTGWLVCTSGKDMGKDYRLVRGFNHVGRDPKMDIYLKTDPTVTRDTHCSIVYDDKENQFFVVPGNGTLTYFKGEIVRRPAKLLDGDELEIGESRFVFISFCKGERVWKKE